jgi:hypothetical protein
MLLVGSLGVTHPTPEGRSPCSAGSMQEQKAPAGPEYAAESLDVAELD